MRRMLRGHKAQLLQSQELEQFQRRTQVPEMDRIKRPAENCYRGTTSQRRICPSPSTMYFSEVRPSRPTGPRA